MTQRILLILFGGIGDLLMFTPALNALAREFPHALIDALVRDDVGARVFRKNPDINEVIIYNRNAKNILLERLRLLRVIRGNHYAVTITCCVDFDFRTGLFAFLSGVSTRIGPAVRRHGIFYNVQVLMDPQKSFIESNYELVQQAGVKKALNTQIRLYLDREERAFAKRFFDHSNFGLDDIIVGVHPGAGPWRSAKRWSNESFAGVIKELSKVEKVRTVLVGGPSERKDVEEIARMSDKSVINAGSYLTLGQFGALIEQCSLLLCNDSGVLQVAAAVRAPTITIVGPTNTRNFAPIGSEHLIVKSDIACSPCIDNYDYNSRACDERTCMASVTVPMVRDAILKKAKSRPLRGRL